MPNKMFLVSVAQAALITLIFYAIYSNFNSVEQNETNNMTDNDPWLFDKVEKGVSIPYNFNYEQTINMENTEGDELIGVIILDRYMIGEILGESGYTGVVRKCVDLNTGQRVAIKFAKKRRWGSLDKEYKNYVTLGAEDGSCLEHGIPQIYYYGTYDDYKIMVMTLLGPTLRDMRNERYDYLTMKTLSLVALQLVDILEYIHSKGLIYHDMKPDNICIGNTKETENKIYLVDFAFSEPVYDENGVPKPRRMLDNFDGTPEYMARGPLHGLSQMRKDDFISLGITMLEMNGAYISWFELEFDRNSIWQSMQTVLKEWEKHGLHPSIESSDNPEFFAEYFDYFDTVYSSDAPDYEHVRNMLRKNLSEEDIRIGDLAFLEGITSDEDEVANEE